MRILYVITKFGIGGAQTHILQLSKHFISQGNDVAVMSSPHGLLEKTVKDIGAKFYPNDFLSNEINPFKDLMAMKKIKNTVKNFEPDLISCHSSKAGFLTRIAVRNKIPTIFTAHGWGFTAGVPFGRKILLLFLEKLASKYCSKIICVSNFDRRLALKYRIALPNKITVIHNGVEIQSQEKDKLRGTREIRIIFIGRLTEPKDPLSLIKAFNDLSSGLKSQANVFIIGDGPKRGELEKFIKENRLEEKVKLLGDMSREKVFGALRKSDIFVLVSNWEGFPRSILEAMSAGLAIIASDVGGVKEAITEDCGILIKRRDQGGLKMALQELLNNPAIIQKMGKKARERVRENFFLDKMLERTERVYRLISLEK